MKKPDILKRFFEEGLLVSPVVLDQINDDNIDHIIKEAKESGINNIQNLDFLGSKEPAPEPETGTQKPIPKKQGLEIVMKEPVKKDKLAPKDFVDFYNRKYEGIRTILANKLQAVSVNNTKNSFSEVSIIGMVREKTPQGFIIEDTTGNLPVISKETGLEAGDVVGVTGFVREGKLMNGNVLYPDIPLSREIADIDATIILTTKPQEGADHIFIRNGQTSGNKHAIMSSPTWIRMNNRINMVYFEFPDEIDPQEVTTWLKKRHLPNKRVLSDEDPYLLDIIPEILWINSKSTWTKIHKGVTVISMTEKDSVRVNLQNKQIEFIDK